MRSKYDANVAPYLERITSWLERGATDKEVASKLGIGASTLRKYLDLGRKGDGRYAPLAEVWLRACKEPDDTVEGALYRRAVGYQYDEVTEEEKLDRVGEVHTLRKVVRKDVPPDPSSAMFWLANRRPARWAYKPGEAKEGKAGAEGGVIEIPAVLPMPEPPEEPGEGEGGSV